MPDKLDIDTKALKKNLEEFIDITLIGDHILQERDPDPQGDITFQHLKRHAQSRLYHILEVYEESPKEGKKYLQKCYKEAYAQLNEYKSILKQVPRNERLRGMLRSYLTGAKDGPQADYEYANRQGKRIKLSDLVDLIITDATFEAMEYMGQMLRVKLTHQGIAWRR